MLIDPIADTAKSIQNAAEEATDNMAAQAGHPLAGAVDVKQALKPVDKGIYHIFLQPVSNMLP